MSTKRKQLSNKEIRNLNETIFKNYNQIDFFSKKDKIELLDEIHFIKGDKVMFTRIDNTIIPTLHTLLEKNFLKKITIDMPAVKFIANGADVMRPGIIHFEDNIAEDEIVSIVDEKNNKPIAVGRALAETEIMKKQERGKVIKNLHFVSDKIWTTIVAP
jgi:PUA-domain protein